MLSCGRRWPNPQLIDSADRDCCLRNRARREAGWFRTIHGGRAYRQEERKSAPHARRTPGLQPAAVLLYEAAGHPQPQPAALLALGGTEGLKEPVADFMGNSAAV